MARRFLPILAAVTLPGLLFVTAGSGVAQALPIFPGSVTCTSTSGVWHGDIFFVPPLKNGGVANNETFKIKAVLGNTTNPCSAPLLTPPTVIGHILGKLKFHVVGAANSCGSIFSGLAIAPVAGNASKFNMGWSTPLGVPTKVKQPLAFSVKGAALRNNITISGGTVAAGSSFPLGVPTVTLADAGWAASIAAGCASAAGLRSLTLSQSTGTW